MKKFPYILYVGFVLMVVAFQACKNDYESVPLEKVTIDYIFDKDDSLGNNAKKYLNSLYAGLQPTSSNYNRVEGDLLDAASDDAVSSAIGLNATSQTQTSRLANGSFDAFDRITGEMLWGQYYQNIRAASIFVNNIDVVPLNDNLFNIPRGMTQKSIWRSEARFLRAYAYFELLKRYGGVPLMGDEVRQLHDNVELPRNTFEACVEYIVSEMDAIKDSLLSYPVQNPTADSHRITKGAALSLKARVLLYAASPLFNGGNIESANPITGYTDYKVDRWNRAANAARDVVSQTNNSLLPSFLDIFLTQNNPEIIFFRQGGNTDNVEQTNGPFGFGTQIGGGGRTSPTESLVSAFGMKNGMAIADPESGYDLNNRYEDRDPRLNWTILHNGSAWLNITLETFDGGRNKPLTTDVQTVTSYYMRKFMGKFETTSNYSPVRRDYIYMRYAEILLNLAEAANEFSGPSTEVYEQIMAIRQRAGIEPGADNMFGLKPNMDQDEMRQVIRNERRVELAFEEHRFWDIRRWKIAEEVMNIPLRGLQIQKVGDNLMYNEIDVFTPSFIAPRMYLFPIPFDEVRKNSMMTQNPGW